VSFGEALAGMGLALEFRDNRRSLGCAPDDDIQREGFVLAAGAADGGFDLFVDLVRRRGLVKK